MITGGSKDGCCKDSTSRNMGIKDYIKIVNHNKILSKYVRNWRTVHTPILVHWDTIFL